MSQSSSEKLGECSNAEGPIQPTYNTQLPVGSSICKNSVMSDRSPINMVESSPTESDVQMLASDSVGFNYQPGGLLSRTPDNKLFYVPYKLLQVGSVHQPCQSPTIIQGHYYPVTYTQPPCPMVPLASTSGYGQNQVGADCPSPAAIGCYGQSFVNNMMVTSARSTPLLYSTTPYYLTPQGNTTSPYFSPTQGSNGLPSTMMTNVAPSFCLNQNTSGCVMPQIISCNIRPVSTQVEMQTTASTPLPVPMTIDFGENSNLESAEVPRMTSPSVITDIVQRTEECINAFKESGDWWSSEINYTEYLEDGGSNLYVTCCDSASDLKDRLEHHDFEVRCVIETNDDQIYNVVFETHSSARKAFITQRSISLRMIPPRHSKKNWWKSASPNFLVKYETHKRLRVREGRAVSHGIVGELLMSNFEDQSGCIIWADQVKGNLIRIVGCVGRFMLPNGRVVEKNEVPSKYREGRKSIGWISYRCKYTKEEWVTRKSGDKIEDYVYGG